jgi:hypothetical protein
MNIRLVILAGLAGVAIGSYFSHKALDAYAKKLMVADLRRRTRNVERIFRKTPELEVIEGGAACTGPCAAQ